MGVCCSKSGKTSFPAKVPSKDPLKGAADSSTTKKDSCIVEGKDEKKGETPVKQGAQFEEEKGSKGAATVTTPLRTSSCTKEEIDAILIQYGRLSCNSSGKTSNEMARQRRHSGSKKSYDFDNDGKEEGEAFDKSTSRPSPCRRTRSGSRERGNSEGRRVSRSPGKRLDGPTSSACDKSRQQPAKMISVPATEKKSLFVNGNTDSGSSDAKKVPAPQSTRSRSPANNTRTSNDNARSQSLSQSSSRKLDESPLRRNPLAEIEDNSRINQNGANISILQRSREMEENAIQSLTIFQANKAEIVEDTVDANLNNGVESLNPLTITRAISSRRTSRDLDNNPLLKPTAYASVMLEDVRNHQQTTAFSFPNRVSKACSIMDSINDLNSSSSEKRSYETDQSNNNSFEKGGLARRVSALQRETLREVKDDLNKPSLHKYVTARDVAPQESAGNNSLKGEVWASSWDLNSVDSSDRCCTSMPCNSKGADVEDEVSQTGSQQPGGGQRSRAASNDNSHTTATIMAEEPLEKKFDHRQLHQSGHGVGCGNGNVHLSATTF